MKLIILTQYYPPEVGAPQRRLSDLAQRMTAQGHEVTVLTAMPNYPRGEIYPRYGGFMRRETIDGIPVIRSFIYPTQRAGLFFRLLSYFSFVISAMILGTFVLKRADYLMVESPPLFLGIAAIWLKWVKRARLIFNVSDLWPDSAVWMGLIRKASLSYRMSAWLERRCYRTAWLVTGQSPDIVEDIQKRFPDVRTHLLSNGVDTGQFGAAYRSTTARDTLTGDGGAVRRDQTFVLMYAGLHGLAQGLHQVVETADKLRGVPQLQFVLVGDGPDKARVRQLAEAKQLQNICFLDGRPFPEIPPLLASADVIMVILFGEITGAIPSKIYEAMASERPVIFVGMGGGTEIIRRFDAGIVVDPEDISGFADAVHALMQQPELREQMGQRGRQAVETYYNRQAIALQFMDVLTQRSEP
jgi:colanic acid biosynthesis glycosyl transferase WcaI